MNIILDDICFRMKKFREKAGYTQQQVSDSLNIDRSTYAYYESGKTLPDLNILLKLSEIFNITLGMLLEKEHGNIIFSDKKDSRWDEPQDKIMFVKPKIGANSGTQKSNSLKVETSPKLCIKESKKSGGRKRHNYPSYISDLSEKEKKMILCFRLLGAKSQDLVYQIIAEKFKNSGVLNDGLGQSENKKF